jgi:hypothetical protein
VSTLAARQREAMAYLHGECELADPRWAIYRRAVHANWQGALAAAYPVVKRLVGGECFAGLAARYSPAHPSAHGDLNRYGAAFATFLQGPAALQGLDYLPDVARLEWALHESHYAANAPGFPFEALASVAEESQPRLRMRLAPSVRLLRSNHPLIDIWQANQPARDGTPERIDGGERVLVARDEFVSAPHALTATEWTVLTGIEAGKTLGALVAVLAEDAAALQAILVEHATRGVICGFDEAA